MADEEMKSENMSEVLMLRRVSSEMRVEPYSRLMSLTNAVNILEFII